MILRQGDAVNVSGEVFYGDTWYNVSTTGIIQELDVGCCLVNLDEIDGDMNVNLYVQNKYIYKN